MMGPPNDTYIPSGNKDNYPNANERHPPITAWMIAWPLNHMGLVVRRYRARRAPAGRTARKPTTQRIACATMSFWYGWSGMPDDPEETVVELEVEVMVLVRSS